MQLPHTDHEKITKFYQNLLKTFGSKDPRSLNWKNSENQIARFETLIKIGDLQNKSILDVGCGVGDLYGFLKDKKVKIESYAGVDIVPDFIRIAKQNFPEATFLVNDVVDLVNHFDYVFASGSLSFKLLDNNHYYLEMIHKMYDLANLGVAFNMLDGRIHESDELYNTYQPQEILNFCKKFCSNTELVTGYLPHDFTIFLRH